MAFHQPGHSDLHRVFWNPPGAGRSLLADAVPDIRCIRNVRAAGNVQILPFGMEINELEAVFIWAFESIWFLEIPLVWCLLSARWTGAITDALMFPSAQLLVVEVTSCKITLQ